MMPVYALKPSARERARQVALIASSLAVLAVGLGGWRLMAVRGDAAELRLQVSGRMARLSEDRRAMTGVPAAKPDALDRSRAVSRLRAALSRVTERRDCAVDEFQASTEEGPYITVYALDNKDPGWTQVPVRASLRGRATAIAATLAELRTFDVPFELDSMEVARRSTDNKGVATVVAQIALRVLVYKGEA